MKIEIQVLRGDLYKVLQEFYPQLQVEATPYNVVFADERIGAKLIHYGPGDINTPLLIIPAIINRQYILDIHPDVSVVKAFYDAGFNVYMIDWGYPGKDHENVSFKDYIEFINKTQEFISNDKISIFGYCTGGIIAVIYAALHPNDVKNLILLATPTDFNLQDIRILWGKWFDVEKVVNIFGNVPGELINLIGIFLFFYHFPRFSMRPGFINEFFSYEFFRDCQRRLRWILDSQMIPGNAYSQFIIDCYKKNLFIKGKVTVGDEVDLKRISMPVLNILARYDHIIAPDSGIAIKKVIPSRDYEEILFPSSHVGLCTSKKAHKNLWPRVCDWLKERS